MSHELRTPLTAIIGYADLLGTTSLSTLDDVTAGFVQRMRTSSWLRDLINQILDLSRIEAGKEDVVLQPVAVGDLVRAAVALVEPEARRRNLALDAELPQAPPTVITDAGKLRQILVNLLSNAVKFTERGGIRVTVEGERGDALVFRVIDTGVGIAAADRERIWEPFTQVDPSSTRSVGGSGLGLSVSRRLARLLDGDLTVASEPGAGSTFTLRFPNPTCIADTTGD